MTASEMDFLEAPRWVRWFRTALEPMVGTPYTLDVSEAKACAETGLSDYGDPWHREGLQRILDDVPDARLNALGRLTLRAGIVRSLGQRLRLVHERNTHPEALTVPVRRPIVIAALPRTGSSFLHRLLAAHPDIASVPLWLGIRPLPAPEPDEWRTAGSRERRRAATTTVRAVRTFQPAMFRKHDIGPDEPVECAYLMMNTFQAVQWWAVWPLYTYGDWLPLQAPPRPVRTYRQTLQLLQRTVEQSGWVLKSPGHLGSLPELATELPQALFVHIHRDPVRVLASTHSLFGTAQSMMTDHLDLQRTVQANTRALHQLAQACVNARDVLDPERVLDVAYDELVADPMAVVERIVVRSGLRWDDDVATALRDCIATQRQHRFGRHTYALSDFGQRESDVSPGFANYQRRFCP